MRCAECLGILCEEEITWRSRDEAVCGKCAEERELDDMRPQECVCAETSMRNCAIHGGEDGRSAV